MSHPEQNEAQPQQSDEPQKQPAARRFLLVFIGCVVVIASLVATVNLIAYRYMLSPHNQPIVQLLSGWGRIYKPILYDEIKPEVAVFGASWARDAFDPIDTGKLLGRSLFNDDDLARSPGLGAKVDENIPQVFRPRQGWDHHIDCLRWLP